MASQAPQASSDAATANVSRGGDNRPPEVQPAPTAEGVTEEEDLAVRIYDNLKSGGWIERVEMGVGMFCGDDTLTSDSIPHYRHMFLDCSRAADHPLDTRDTMRPRIEAAGFINVEQQDYKVSIGQWPNQKVYKDARRVAKMHYLSGVQGWTVFMLTHFGQPQPWSIEQVQVWLAKMRSEVNAGYHVYQKARRVYAQKPFDGQRRSRQ